MVSASPFFLVVATLIKFSAASRIQVEHCYYARIAKISSSVPRASPLPETIRNVNDTLVEIDNVITPYERNELLILDECMQIFASQTYQDRSFGDGSYGGNIVTYLSGYAQKIIPHILTKMKNIANSALTSNKLGQTVDSVDGLGLRCVEFLFYRQGMKLNMHTDTDSYFTMIVALSHQNDYEGGNFMIDSVYDGLVLIRPNMNSGIIFNSILNHGRFVSNCSPNDY